MEEYKKDLFLSEYGIAFPDSTELTGIILSEVQFRLFDSFNFSKKDTIDFLHSFSETSFDALDNDFKLIDVYNQYRIVPLKKIYINWNDFEKIDKIDVDFLDKYFDDIWFPSVDDIEIFDDTFNWMISIRHYGSVMIKQKI